jgi:hypothetical protein
MRLAAAFFAGLERKFLWEPRPSGPTAGRGLAAAGCYRQAHADRPPQ